MVTPDRAQMLGSLMDREFLGVPIGDGPSLVSSAVMKASLPLFFLFLFAFPVPTPPALAGAAGGSGASLAAESGRTPDQEAMQAQKRMERHPRSSRARALWVRALLQAGRIPEAVAAADPGPGIRSSCLLWEVRGEAQQAAGGAKSALEILQGAPPACSSSLRLLRVKLFLEMGDPAAALPLAHRAVLHPCQRRKALPLLFRAAAGMGNAGLALRAALASPRGSLSPAHLAVAVRGLMDGGHFHESILLLRCPHAPTQDPTVVGLLAEALRRVGRPEEAAEVLALLPPGNGGPGENARLDALVEASRGALAEGNWEEAWRLTGEALALSPLRPDLLSQGVETAFRTGRITDARALLERLLEVDPGNDKARRNLQRLKEGR